VKKYHATRWIMAIVLLGGLLSTLFACTSGPMNSKETNSLETTGYTSAIDESTSDVGGKEPGTEEETMEGETMAVIEGEFANSIVRANELTNTVQAYYSSSAREIFRHQNKDIIFDCPLAGDDYSILSLRTADGKVYLEKSLDVYIKDHEGRFFYSSGSKTAPQADIYRFGYYYYETHIIGQDFRSDLAISNVQPLSLQLMTKGWHSTTKPVFVDGTLTYNITGDDGFIHSDVGAALFNTRDANALRITMSTTATSAMVYLVAGDSDGFGGGQFLTFNPIADGQPHTYFLMLEDVPNYYGDVRALRLDTDGVYGTSVVVSEIAAVWAETHAPKICLDKTYHLYADKVNAVATITATEDGQPISALGVETRLPKDDVDKLIILDESGQSIPLNTADWSTVVGVAFDMKDVGVFGLILPSHDKSGTLMVIEDNDSYIVRQELTYTTETLSKDEFFSMGYRFYTDETHDFETFKKETWFERNPLTDENIQGGSFAYYDAMRGAYRFDITGNHYFTDAYRTNYNQHHTASVAITGGENPFDNSDRSIYVYTYTNSGFVENAVVMDKNSMLLPIPVEVMKNFGFGHEEEPLFHKYEPAFGEALLPMVITTNQTTEFTVLNLYQNWGKYPLKQLSSIAFLSPYYHLSTGVTETSCISPMYVYGKDLWTLPDFRSMSAPFWFDMNFNDQPQHTRGGFQQFLQYTDANGDTFASENIYNDIDASGPSYADIDMNYLSDDGNIAISYRHLEMPQTDEHRAYYEISYEVLEDVHIKDFRKDFSFYSADAICGKFTTLGYLNANNEYASISLNQNARRILLGTDCPYISLYDFEQSNPPAAEINNQNHINIGAVIYNSEIIINGEKCTAHWMLRVESNRVYLTLDLGKVTLTKGDKIKINMILVPWGSHLTEGDDLMRKVRENTCLDPLKVDVSEGEDLNDIYMPKIKSVNGYSAEFALSGGDFNTAVRVYGFKKLTAPKIYEYIDGEWVVYDVSSQSTPDKSNNAHAYDGYYVYYEGDGTYSYSFVTTIEDGAERKFKIVAEDDFVPYPEIQEPETETSQLNVALDSQDILSVLEEVGSIGGAEIRSEDGTDFVRIYGDGKSVEAYATFLNFSAEQETGQYIVLKYRLPQDVPEKMTAIQFYTSTENADVTGRDVINIPNCVQDGEWHVLVIDASSLGVTFVADESGQYKAKYVRYDFFNTVVSSSSYIDVAAFGMSARLSDICEEFSDMPSITIRNRYKETIIDPKTGNPIVVD